MAKKVLIKIGIILGSLAATYLFIYFIYTMSLDYWKIGSTFAVSLTLIPVFYFWGVWFTLKEGWRRVIGVIILLPGLFYNLLMLASSGDSQSEFNWSRLFVLFGLAAGIFLLFRPSKFLRIFGIIVGGLTVLAMIFGYALRAVI